MRHIVVSLIFALAHYDKVSATELGPVSDNINKPITELNPPIVEVD